MIYGSVCSGIEAATVAWHPLGWRAAFFAEIEKFPSSVLKHHYPDVPNLGDFTRIHGRPGPAIDVLVGGTPCQSFSIAGLRGGVADARGNLALEFLRLAGRERPRWVVWENVPGVLSSLSHDAPDARPPRVGVDGQPEFGVGEKRVEVDEYDADESHAFACFVAGLSELGYGVAWRVLDAQFFGVAQRRNRVFVVGCLGNWAPAAAVLFERASLRGDSAPRRTSGEDVAGTIGGGAGARGWCDDLDRSGAFIPGAAPFIANAEGAEEINLTASCGSKGVNNQTPLVAFDLVQLTNPDNRSNPAPGDPAPTVSKSSRMHVAELAPTIQADHSVRRLTPREYERLFGFPDDYTKISPSTSDGPRYRALGNTMVVGVMAWIGRRIEAVERILKVPDAR